MNSITVFLAVVSIMFSAAEPPSGYSYPRGGGGGGFGSNAGGRSSGFSSFGVSSSGYQAVSGGFQTSEGQNVDPQLLDQVRQILLREESHGPSGSAGTPSSSYGVPSTSYGVPSHSGGRVVGIDLEGIRQAIQVAQFAQTSTANIGSSSPSGSYGPPRAPSGSYGAPY